MVGSGNDDDVLRCARFTGSDHDISHFAGDGEGAVCGNVELHVSSSPDRAEGHASATLSGVKGEEI